MADIKSKPNDVVLYGALLQLLVSHETEGWVYCSWDPECEFNTSFGCQAVN